MAIAALTLALQVLPPRRAEAESLADFKVMYYLEDNNRIKVFAPAFLFQKELSPTLTIKIDGIYNSISGATPTGAPPPPAAAPAAAASFGTYVPPPPRPPSDDEEDDGRDDRGERDQHGARIAGPPMRASTSFVSISGATPAPAPAPSPSRGGGGTALPLPVPTAPASGMVPTAEFDDHRCGVNVELIKKLERHTASGLASFSTESDYTSIGLSLKDAVDFNRKNTTLLMGAALTHDVIDPANGVPGDTKDTGELIVGVTQILDPRTFLTANLTVGRLEGFLSDPYKVVELNGVLVSERRPDSKDKEILYFQINRFVEALKGAAEISYRFYTDSFGIDSHTVALEWFQKLGPVWVLRPLLRYSEQSEADFYGVRFTGSPEFYASDYRASAFAAVSYGLKITWIPSSRFSCDLGYERYVQEGKDGVTAADAYPAANIVVAGARLWF